MLLVVIKIECSKDELGGEVGCHNCKPCSIELLNKAIPGDATVGKDEDKGCNDVPNSVF